MNPIRRDVLALSLGGIAAPAVAQLPAGERYPTWPPAERFALWSGVPPGAPAVLPRPTPEITGRPGEYHDIWMRGTAYPDVGVFRPARPDGRSVLIVPGGGYGFVSLRNEGMDVARVLNVHGITGFVLNYRLPGDGWADRADVPLADAQRAMRLIRAGARRYAIDPNRLGVLGFSAGGHLAGSLATLFDIPAYRAIDAADRQSARPAFAGLLYAVTTMAPGGSRGGSRANLLGPDPAAGAARRYTLQHQLGFTTPPLFLAAAADDPLVPVANTLAFAAAAREARVPVEEHVFETGGHGFGTRLLSSSPGSLWPELFRLWMANRTIA